MPEQRAIGPRVDAMLDQLWQLKGTDLLLTAGMPPQLRVDGSLRPVTGVVPIGKIAPLVLENIFDKEKPLASPEVHREILNLVPDNVFGAVPGTVDGRGPTQRKLFFYVA